MAPRLFFGALLAAAGLPGGCRGLALPSRALGQSRSAFASAAGPGLANASRRISLAAGRVHGKNWDSDHFTSLVLGGQGVAKTLSENVHNVEIFLLFAVCFGYAFHVFYNAYSEFDEFQKVPEFTRTFGEFLHYRIAYWFVWTKGSKAHLLCGVCVVFVLIGTGVYSLLLKVGIPHAAYVVVCWLFDPNGGRDEITRRGAAIGVIASGIGVVVFALLLALVQDSFSNFLDDLAQGNSPVIENGHILLIGFNHDTLPLLTELCASNESKGGAVIVILSDTPKADVERRIRNDNIAMRGSRVVVRTGDPLCVRKLADVSVSLCSSVVIVPDRREVKELRDAFVLQVLISMCGNGWPRNGHILAVCSLPRNMSLFKRIAGPRLQLVMLDEIIGNLNVSCSRQLGAGFVISQLFQCNGADLQIVAAPPTLHGLPFSETLKYYPHCAVLGIIQKGSDGQDVSTLCPARDFVLCAGVDLVVIAKDAESTECLEKPIVLPLQTISQFVKTRETPVKKKSPPETVFFLGWNDNVPMMILDIDKQVSRGSRALVFAKKPVEDRQAMMQVVQRRQNENLENITQVIHDVGQLGSRYQLEELSIKIENASRIFVLSDDDLCFQDDKHADACTVTTTLQVRDILAAKDHASDIPTVPEIRTRVTADICEKVYLADFVGTTKISAQVLATLYREPRLCDAVQDIVSVGEAEVFIRPLSEYVKPHATPEDLCYLEVMCAVAHSGDVLLGWSVPPPAGAEAGEDAGCAARRAEFQERMNTFMAAVQSQDPQLGWVLNPWDKMARRQWLHQRDRLIILGRTELF